MLDRMLLASASTEALYVEDVFSTYLYTGNGSTQTINNGIDLAGKGGLVWIKNRSTGADHLLYDTSRGANLRLATNTTNGTGFEVNQLNSFNSNGFTLGNDGALNAPNRNADNYASWTFREAPKFFDVVTYTGNGANRTIAHNLGVAPGCIIVKRTDTTADWQVYHRSNANTEYMVLNSTAAKATGTTRWNSTTPTASEFTVGTDATVNASGGTYVAYLFAHDATADGIIQCGSYTGNGSATGPTVTLGWEPQWLLVKDATTASYDWRLVDNMRGMPVGSGAPSLFPNLSNAEFTSSLIGFNPTATGFEVAGSHASTNANGSTYIYIAIRRGPMKTPTVGTSVFSPLAVTPVTGTVRTTGFPVDLSIAKTRTLTYGSLVTDRLRGFVNSTATNPPTLVTASTNGETTATYSSASYAFDNTGYKDGPELNGGYPTAYWNFRRAPGFFDVVAYTGTGVARTINHNLGVAPELMIVKSRSAAGSWRTYDATDGNTKYMELQDTRSPIPNSTNWNNTSPTSSVFTLGTNANVNASGTTYVAYLFASCPGVSKVGSYTGNGSSQTINCGFSNGSRFFLVKRTDSAGDWWVYDSARGIVAAADPALRLNSTAAEVTSADAVDTDSTGIIVNQEATCNINVNGGTYIYLAIA